MSKIMILILLDLDLHIIYKIPKQLFCQMAYI